MQPPNLSVYGNQPLYSSPKTAWVNFLLFSLSLVSAADGIDKGDENAFREEIWAEASAFQALGQKWRIALRKVILFNIEEILRCPVENMMTGEWWS